MNALLKKNYRYILVGALMAALPLPGMAADYGTGLDFGTPMPLLGRADWLFPGDLELGRSLPPDNAALEGDHAQLLQVFGLDWEAQQLKQSRQSFEANLLSNPVWRAGPVLQVRRNLLTDPETDASNLFDDANAVELGGFVGIDMRDWDAKLTLVKDVNEEHQGYLTTISGGYTLPLSRKSALRLGAETTYGSASYMDHYFRADGISQPSPDGLGRDGKGDFRDIGLNANLRYDWTKNWSVSGILSFQRLLNDDGNPLVEDENPASMIFGGVLGIYEF